MNFVTFSATTLLGSAISCGLLAYLGHRAYQLEPQLLTDPDAMVHFVKSQSRWVLLLVFAFAVLYFLALRLMHGRRS